MDAATGAPGAQRVIANAHGVGGLRPAVRARRIGIPRHKGLLSALLCAGGDNLARRLGGVKLYLADSRERRARLAPRSAPGPRERPGALAP